MRIGIIGAGSLGLLWAARLAQHGSVTLMCRTKRQTEQLQKLGITLIDLEDKRETYQISAEWIEQLTHSAPFDVIFLMVKQPSLDDVLLHVPDLIHKQTHIVAWQNGLGHVEKLLQLQHPFVYAIVTTEGANKLTDTSVRHTGLGYKRLGNLKIDTTIDHKFSAFLQNIGIKIVSNIMQEMWFKFAINCLINPLTALLEVPNGGLLNPNVAYMFDPLIREICFVAKHIEIQLDPDTIKKQVIKVCEKTAKNHSSMLQDIKAGRPTEIDYLNQMLVQYGFKVGVSAPYNQMLAQLIKAKSELQSARDILMISK